ncbi:hypothetical protein MLD38_028225 [Melastoma candidum]|uniref:Uncharacterized protein n=1 Tax=Melastoma candidum TaxID=119954 RepID=A0ACB9N063_9MYRT|nr:hypothetical protein MLD38_028225 [Melastoma candidum]
MGSMNDGHLDSDPEDDKDEDLELRRAVKALLEGMGEDTGREGLRRTSLRVSKSLLHATRGYRQKVKDIVQDALFPEVGWPNVNGQGMEDDLYECWCPLLSTDSSSFEMLYPGLTVPMTSIIRSLGENPMRKELAGTPARFLQWLMNFQNTSLQINVGNFDIRPIDPSRPKRGENGHTEHFDSELNLPFCALCEHYLLPFHGVLQIG